jgi:hypothetical protein
MSIVDFKIVIVLCSTIITTLLSQLSNQSQSLVVTVLSPSSPTFSVFPVSLVAPVLCPSSLNVLTTRIRFCLAFVRPSYIPVVLIDLLLRTPTFPVAIFPTQIIDIIYLSPRVQSEVESLAFTPVLRSPLGVCLVDHFFLKHSDAPQTYQCIQVYGLSNEGMHPMCEL